MAIIDNTLASQVPTFDPAAPLAQAAKIQSMQQENQAAQYKQMQTEIGSEARGLTPFVNTPEFPARWAETADRMLAKGLMDPQTHQKWRNTPSPLLLKQMITQTEDPTLTFQKSEAARSQGNADRTHNLAVRTADRLDAAAAEGKYTIQQVTDPTTGGTSLVRVKASGPEGPISTTGASSAPANPALNPKSPFNAAMVKQDAKRVSEYADSGKMAQEGIATLDFIDGLRKQAYTGPIQGAIANKLGHPATQALDGAVNALALDVAQKMKGSLSDKDIGFVKSQVPTLSMGGTAGEATSGLMRAAFERTQQRAQFYRDWVERKGNINGADKQWNKFANENPLTVEDKKALGGRKFDPGFKKDYGRYIPPSVGEVQNGYRFKGGDPKLQSSWEPAQ
jgi:hypothetical protein